MLTYTKAAMDNRRNFKGKDFNVIIFQNMPNLQNRHKSAEKKFNRKTRNIRLNTHCHVIAVKI
jgi:hypothetical protein